MDLSHWVGCTAANDTVSDALIVLENQKHHAGQELGESDDWNPSGVDLGRANK